MIEKISIGITEFNDAGQNSKTIFNPDQESITITEKSHEAINIPKNTTAMSIGFGTGITAPTLLMLRASGALTVTLGDGVSTVTFNMLEGESYRLPTGITSIAVTNADTKNDVTLEKIIGE